jgi:hypothetical protein
VALHFHNDYVRQQAQRVRPRKRVAESQLRGTKAKRARATFSPTFHTHWREVMRFEKVGSQKSGSSSVIDFQIINIHTGWYAGSTQASEAPSAT